MFHAVAYVLYTLNIVHCTCFIGIQTFSKYVTGSVSFKRHLSRIGCAFTQRHWTAVSPWVHMLQLDMFSHPGMETTHDPWIRNIWWKRLPLTQFSVWHFCSKSKHTHTNTHKPIHIDLYMHTFLCWPMNLYIATDTYTSLYWQHSSQMNAWSAIPKRKFLHHSWKFSLCTHTQWVRT